LTEACGNAGRKGSLDLESKRDDLCLQRRGLRRVGTRAKVSVREKKWGANKCKKEINQGRERKYLGKCIPERKRRSLKEGGTEEKKHKRRGGRDR